MEPKTNPKKENIILNLLCNIVIPVLIMTKLNGTEGQFSLGPKYSLCVALLFPLIYGICDFFRAKKVNFISVLGFISVLLTGTFGLLELNPLLLAIKEASIPLIISIFIFVSIKMDRNLVSSLLFNEEIIDLSRVYSVLDERNKREEFNEMFKKSSYWVVVSFLLSSVLNFTLARIILQSEPGTEAYTAEIGKLTGLSFPVIAVPCTIILVIVMFHIFNQITKMTDIPLEELLKTK
ncbi:MAG: hypothetical protein MJ198_03065 [Bacteroidales bacterium]|nr:hypothetical protein [Bacteroidales bacterium]